MSQKLRKQTGKFIFFLKKKNAKKKQTHIHTHSYTHSHIHTYIHTTQHNFSPPKIPDLSKSAAAHCPTARCGRPKTTMTRSACTTQALPCPACALLSSPSRARCCVARMRLAKSSCMQSRQQARTGGWMGRLSRTLRWWCRRRCRRCALCGRGWRDLC